MPDNLSAIFGTILDYAEEVAAGTSNESTCLKIDKLQDIEQIKEILGGRIIQFRRKLKEFWSAKYFADPNITFFLKIRFLEF